MLDSCAMTARKKRVPQLGRPRVVKKPRSFAIDFEQKDFDELERLADREERSIAFLVRKAVSEYLVRQKRRK